MQIDPASVKEYIDRFEFETLFIEKVGWNYSEADQETIALPEGQFTLSPVAEVSGLVVYQCSPAADGSIPGSSLRRKLEKKLATRRLEHLIIFGDAARQRQIWQRVRRLPGQPERCREIEYHKGQSALLLAEKLNVIAFTMEQFAADAEVSIFYTSHRVDEAFVLEERVTRRFYNEFSNLRSSFIRLIEGLPDEHLSWYASIMMNRLMFIYFIQKKTFVVPNSKNDVIYGLDNDEKYLLTRLEISAEKGADLYYREFLQPLFFEGFACPEDLRSAETNRLLGKIPYLNGGLFLKHELEEKFPDLNIPDRAFKAIFEFFGRYNWRLDERPVAEGNEINPEILGYIFEKYINQKQMGAYYTKEDITEYISKHTIIPCLLDTVSRKVPAAFAPDGSVWSLLSSDPERYIYAAVQKGMELELPEPIAQGISDVSRRTLWNAAAAEEYALPTESWREVIARRQRCAEVREILRTGQAKTVNDLITLNLDIRQFIQDVIETTDDPALLRAIFYTLAGRAPSKSNEKRQRGMSILDPTCGSGAFLFAALNILEPLYEACLDRMTYLVEAEEAYGSRSRKLFDFKEIIIAYNKPAHRRYSILKTIIVQNLYGVDIMPEAVEICKLRLFLKMVSQVNYIGELEPLPDIDFNIKAGNTLVGFTSMQEVRNVIQYSRNFGGLFDDPLVNIKEELDKVERLFTLFQEMQSGHPGDDFSRDEYLKAKNELKSRLSALEDRLNEYLAGEYDIDAKAKRARKQYRQWKESHQPFHWLVEFYGIMEKEKGFDVIIGNPPYVEYNKVKRQYTVKNYDTLACSNLYAFIVERNALLGNMDTYSGMIIPHSAFCTDRMLPLMNILKNHDKWISTYDIRPSKLFIGVDQRLAIYIAKGNNDAAVTYSTKYYRWSSEYRQNLFDTIRYCPLKQKYFTNIIAKIGDDYIIDIFEKVMNKRSNALNNSTGDSILYYHNAPRYWIRATTFAPYFWNERDGEQLSSQVKVLYARTEEESSIIAAVLNSSVFYIWFIMLSDCRHLNAREVVNFPLSLDTMKNRERKALAALCDDLMASYQANAYRKTCQYRTTGQVVYDEYYPKLSKDIIDEIDRTLARFYGFTAEELDFIINYDLKYRMGQTEAEDDETPTEENA